MCRAAHCLFRTAAKISIAAAMIRTGVAPELRLTGHELVDKGQRLRVGLRHDAGSGLTEEGRRGRREISGRKCAKVLILGKRGGSLMVLAPVRDR